MAELFFSVTQQTISGLGSLLVEVSISHTIRHTYTQARAIGLLFTNDQLVAEAATHTTNATDENLWPQRNSNPQTQQSSRSRINLQNAQPPGSAGREKLLQSLHLVI
jgi:hypothetical protein